MVEMWRAARKGDMVNLTILWEKDHSLIHACTKTGWRAIHFAARYDNINALEFLLSKGANPNVTTNVKLYLLYSYLQTTKAKFIIWDLLYNKS